MRMHITYCNIIFGFIDFAIVVYELLKLISFEFLVGNYHYPKVMYTLLFLVS